MCCNLDHIRLLFLAFDTSFLSSNEVGNAASRPLESKVNKKKTFFLRLPRNLVPHFVRSADDNSITIKLYKTL